MSSAESDNDDDQLQSDASHRSHVNYSELPSQMPTPRVGPNKVQELVQDNQSLRITMGMTAENLRAECAKMEDFYQRVKMKSREISATFQFLHEALAKKERVNRLLRADNMKLQDEGFGRDFARLKLDGKAQINGEEYEKFKADYAETVSDLQQELLKSEEEKSVIENRYQQHFAQLESTWKNWGAKLRTDYQKYIEQVQSEHNMKIQQQLREHEITEQSMKEQVTSLIKEIRGYQLELEEKEKDLGKVRSQVERTESRIFAISRDARNAEGQNKSMTERIIGLKQELEEARRQKNEKEESLEQLFKVYNEEREKNQKLELDKARISEKLDKIYAQYLSAEESIKKKNEEIDALRDRVRERHASEDQNPEADSLWRQQADIFKKDFEMEREAHLRVHKENMELKKMLGQYELEMQKLKTELMKYHHQAHQYH